ncbi:MAG: transglutaminase domain-containing protein [Lachnospiraceae bacterium]|nr:transglutaminase domain-containing protein [Lachnospiraceae bacterium]
MCKEKNSAGARLLKPGLAIVCALLLVCFHKTQARAAGPTVYGGVDYAAVYDYDYYISQYADLRAAFGNDANAALRHFVVHGMNEHRQAIATFNVDVYKNNYDDLRAAFGDNIRSYYLHYINHGLGENRKATGSLPASAQQNQQAPQGIPAGSSQQARDRLAQTGRDLQAAYNWASSLTWTGDIKSPDIGTRAMANIGFTTGTGGCYVMAACFYEMARDLGYEAHQMTGVVPLRTGGVGPHSWVEVVINGTTYIVDPDFHYETGRNGYLIQYGQSGTWRYQDYRRMN